MKLLKSLAGGVAAGGITWLLHVYGPELHIVLKAIIVALSAIVAWKLVEKFTKQ
ncbi:hypothetical protein [Rheinheimera aquimaris]|uniref:hypothetical protein n=1 Tax=Rheinheimera aquimaris TaxID=412437 RepID=UPI003A974720